MNIFKIGCLFEVLLTIYIRSVAWFYDAPVLLSTGQNYCDTILHFCHIVLQRKIGIYQLYDTPFSPYRIPNKNPDLYVLYICVFSQS